jgi:hypothetical protein
MIRDQDMRAILAGLLASGCHDDEKVVAVVDLAEQYVNEMEKRRTNHATDGADLPMGRRMR